jgi:hypothetical protein
MWNWVSISYAAWALNYCQLSDHNAVSGYGKVCPVIIQQRAMSNWRISLVLSQFLTYSYQVFNLSMAGRKSIRLKWRSPCVNKIRDTTSSFNHSDQELLSCSNISSCMKIRCFVQKLWPGAYGVCFHTPLDKGIRKSSMGNNQKIPSVKL